MSERIEAARRRAEAAADRVGLFGDIRRRVIRERIAVERLREREETARVIAVERAKDAARSEWIA